MAAPGYPPPPQQPYGYPPPQPGYPPPPQPGYGAPPPQPGYPPYNSPQPIQYPGYPPPGQHQYPPPQPGQPPYNHPQQPPYQPQHPQHSPYPQGPHPPVPPPQGYVPQGYNPQPYPAQHSGYPPQPHSPYLQQQGTFPPPQQQGSFPPPQQQGTYPPQGYASHAFAPSHGMPGASQPGYGQASATYVSDISAIYKACKGFGCDERSIIAILAHRDAATINAIRDNYQHQTKKYDLIQHLIKETSGNLETTLVATALGPDDSEAFWAHKAMDGIGTNEILLTEALMGKKNWQMANIKKAYRSRYNRDLERDLKGDLSGKTERLFLMAIEECKQEDWIQPDLNRVEQDVVLLWNAGEGKVGTDEITFAQIFTRSNDAYLRELNASYERHHGTSLTKVISKEFSGHLKQALNYILDGALNKPARDAQLLEDSMKGLGTKDTLLISRLVRIHWDKGHLEAVKREYFRMFQKDLIARIRNDTSGNYERMLVALAT